MHGALLVSRDYLDTGSAGFIPENELAAISCTIFCRNLEKGIRAADIDLRRTAGEQIELRPESVRTGAERRAEGLLVHLQRRRAVRAAGLKTAREEKWRSDRSRVACLRPQSCGREFRQMRGGDRASCRPANPKGALQSDFWPAKWDLPLSREAARMQVMDSRLELAEPPAPERI